MRRINVLVIAVFLSVVLASASELEAVQNGENLVKSRVSCSNLNSEQLESIGEYFMELMHPGELHELMDTRMGGEGSETLRQAHINIAKMMYCGDRTAMPQNMMNLMMNRGGYGMMGNFYSGYGMMGTWGLLYGGWIMLFWILVIILAIYFVYKILQKKDFSFSVENNLDILKRRYAKGEITRKEFEQMKKAIKS